jgi:hypothetical protein
MWGQPPREPAPSEAAGSSKRSEQRTSSSLIALDVTTANWLLESLSGRGFLGKECHQAAHAAAIRTSSNRINRKSAAQTPLLPTRFPQHKINLPEKNPTSVRNPRKANNKKRSEPKVSHPLTTQIRIKKTYPVNPCVLCVKDFSLPKKRKGGRKGPPTLGTRYWVLGTTSQQPQPPASTQQSPSLQSAPEHSPRWPRYPCMHPHKDAGFHPHASPAH